MKNTRIDIWLMLLGFAFGSVFCYITVQFHLFEVELKLNVPELVMSAASVLAAIYVANTIQKNLNKSQNRYSYLEGKLDDFWKKFSKFSQTITPNDNLQLRDLTTFVHEATLSLTFLKSIYRAYSINDQAILNLEVKIDSFQDFLENHLTVPIQANILNLVQDKNAIMTSLGEIEKSFAALLEDIHNQ